MVKIQMSKKYQSTNNKKYNSYFDIFHFNFVLILSFVFCHVDLSGKPMP